MFQSRTHNCGELRIADAGKTVTLVGWMENVREVGQNFAFVVLRDFYGTTQLVVDTQDMERAKSFKVESRRGDKSFPLTSIELSQYVGGELADAYPDVPVDVHDPDLTVHIEIRDYAAFVHGAPVPGAGGMPLGSNGSAVALLSGGIDSPVSTYMIARRGVKPIPVHFFSFPYTSEQAKEKVVELTRILTQYCGSMTIEVVPFTHIQEEIRDKCPEKYFTLIMESRSRMVTQLSAGVFSSPTVSKSKVTQNGVPISSSRR